MHFTSKTKKALREEALLRRMQMPVAGRMRAAQAIIDHVLSVLMPRPDSVIAGYWAIKGEVDVVPLLLEMIRRGHRAALPQVAEFRKPLIFRAWHEHARMQDGRYGIREPDPAEADAVVPDIILVPMLAFDERGGRLGYGSGFYDRTFDSLKTLHKVTAIGIAWDMQKLEGIPQDPYDYPMDMIVTEKNIYRFEKDLM